MVEAFQEELITIDELRARMPDLRAREAGLRGQLRALDAQVADRQIYLRLADDLEGFLTQLVGHADTTSVADRQHLLRLLVNDVLIGPEKITIRHRIPVRERTGAGEPPGDSAPDTEGDHGRSYPLRWGRDRRPLANLALSVLDEHCTRAWQRTSATRVDRARRHRHGLANLPLGAVRR